MRASVGTEVELHESVSEKSDPLLLALTGRREGRRERGRRPTWILLDLSLNINVDLMFQVPIRVKQLG